MHLPYPERGRVAATFSCDPPLSIRAWRRVGDAGRSLSEAAWELDDRGARWRRWGWQGPLWAGLGPRLGGWRVLGDGAFGGKLSAVRVLSDPDPRPLPHSPLPPVGAPRPRPPAQARGDAGIREG